MPRFNQLTRTDTVTAGDIVAIFVQNDGDARGAAMSVLQAFMQENLNFQTEEFTTQYASPSATGFSISIINGPDDVHLILTPTATFAAGTIVLPAVANVVDKQEVLVNSTQAVTALTINANGATAVTGAPTSLNANDAFLLKYDINSSSWYMVAYSVQLPVTANGVQTLTNKTISGGIIAGSQLLSVDIGGSSTGVLTGFTGLPIGTGVAGLGAGIAAFLAAPTSANLAAAVTNETGSGLLVFATSPTLITPALGAATADSIQRGAVATKITNFTLAANENWVSCNGSGTITVTLPSAASFPGREIMLKTIAAFTVVSASANVLPLAGGAAATAILAATAGKYATLVSDGANWVIMQAN